MACAPFLLSNLTPSVLENKTNIVMETNGLVSSDESVPHFFPACQCDDCFLEDDSSICESPKTTESWKKIRYALIWSPFLQQYKRYKYPWLQLAGHQGTFSASEDGTILKKYCPTEAACLLQLKDDLLRPYVPQYFAVVQKDEQKFVQMQDLLSEFKNPSLMDCKLGIRSFTEDELIKASQAPVSRKDMYLKMVQVDPNEPTADENVTQSITKPRYMKWRDLISSTSTLGFRIEGVKKSRGEVDHNFKKTKDISELTKYFRTFTDANIILIKRYTQRLKALLATIEVSKFAQTHELIGTSLFFVHDDSMQASVWMIDFGKSVRLPPNRHITHHDVWQAGNYEDGYCIGLQSIITILQNLLNEKNEVQECCSDKTEEFNN